MPRKPNLDSFEVVLEKIICSEVLDTQESIVKALKRYGVPTPDQSTISRTLKRLGVVKLRDNRTGKMIYRWPPKKIAIAPPRAVTSLVRDVVANESTVIVHTDPGSAALVARYLDVHRPAGILGTIAGDDAIFVAPHSISGTKATMQELKAVFGIKR